MTYSEKFIITSKFVQVCFLFLSHVWDVEHARSQTFKYQAEYNFGQLVHTS